MSAVPRSGEGERRGDRGSQEHQTLPTNLDWIYRYIVCRPSSSLLSPVSVKGNPFVVCCEGQCTVLRLQSVHRLVSMSSQTLHIKIRSVGTCHDLSQGKDPLSPHRSSETSPRVINIELIYPLSLESGLTILESSGNKLSLLRDDKCP